MIARANRALPAGTRRALRAGRADFIAQVGRAATTARAARSTQLGRAQCVLTAGRPTTYICPVLYIALILRMRHVERTCTTTTFSSSSSSLSSLSASTNRAAAAAAVALALAFAHGATFLLKCGLHNHCCFVRQ